MRTHGPRAPGRSARRRLVWEAGMRSRQLEILGAAENL
jgi:hypothetical protein